MSSKYCQNRANTSPRVAVGDRSIAAVGIRLPVEGRASARFNLTDLKAEVGEGERGGISASTTQSGALRLVLDAVPILQKAEGSLRQR